MYIQRIQIFKQIHTIYTSNVHTFPLNFHFFVFSTKSNFSTRLDYLYILCTPSRFGMFIDFPSIFLEFLHSTNSNFFTNSNFCKAFTIRWFIRVIHFSFMEFVHYSYGYIFKKTQKPFKCNNCTNVKNLLCRKQWTIFMRKQQTVLLTAKNRFYECSKQIRIYSKHDV